MINSCPKCKNEIPTGAPESVCPNCLLENDPVEESPFPKESLGQIGNFTLVEEIARGGMGVVYKAYQEDLNRTVAIKMIRGGRFADDRELKRFQAEAEAARGLVQQAGEGRRLREDLGACAASPAGDQRSRHPCPGCRCAPAP